MHIKKLILFLFLVPVFASAQKTTGANYTYIAQRYEWLAGVFKALGLPAGDSAQFQPGQEMRAGAVYYDSVGVDSGLYVWSGLAWIEAGGYTDADARAAISMTNIGTSGLATYTPATGIINTPDYSTTASEGLTKVGSDFQLGRLYGSSGSELTTNREVDMNGKSLYFNSKIFPTVSSHIGINILDSMASQNPASLLETGGNFSRRIRVTGPYYAEYRNGFRLALVYEGADSVPIDTKGGDFGGGVVNELRLQPLATHNSRTVFTSRDGAGPLEAPFGGLSQLVVKGHSGASSYMRGYFAGHTSLFVMDSGQPDTLENFIHYAGRGYAPSPSKVLKSFFIRPTGLVGDSIWLLYDNSNYKSYLTGSVAIGGTTGTATASSLLDVTSTTKGVIWPRMTTTQKNAIASPATGLIVFDTDLVQYNFWDGDSWESMGGGGGDVTKVGTPVNNQLGIWTGDGTIEGATALTFDGDKVTITPTSTITGTEGLNINGEFIVKKTSSSGYRFLSRGAGTISAEDASGFGFLTSANAAQHVNAKGLFLGASYSGAAANAGEIKTASNTDLTLTPQGTGKVVTSKQIQMSEMASPSTPSAGTTSIYPKTDGLWYGKDDAGVETKLSNDAAAATAFNDIGDATGSGFINVNNNSQQWSFAGLTGSGLLIEASTTAATSFTHKLFRVLTSGANASSSVTSLASEISNAHSGTSSTNIGLAISAINGTNNHALVVGDGNGNVGFGTETPSATAILELSSTTKGLLLPRMTKTQRDAISSPVAGLSVYQTDNTPGLRVYNGTNWMRFTETAD